MKEFTSPLNNIRVASPCSSPWYEMVGNDRTRFCGECKRNVYNLSGMTRAEAENLLFESEGRLCVRFFRRADGTVLTQDCPVGWRAVKRRASRVTTAVSASLLGFFSGLFAIRGSEGFISLFPIGDVPPPKVSIYSWSGDDPFDTVVVGQLIDDEPGIEVMGKVVPVRRNQKQRR